MTYVIRVLLADDHPLMRSGIAATLAHETDMTLVGEASDGNQVQALCLSLQQDILLLDLNMPGPPITTVIPALHAQCSDTKILVLTAYDDTAYVQGILALGVAGYILKEEAPAAIVQAIRAVVQGAAWFSGTIAQKLTHPAAPDPSTALLASLTPREREILEVIAQGWDNARIAHTLHLAEQTVRNYTSRLYEKLGVTSRAEAIVWAKDQGIGQLERE